LLLLPCSNERAVDFILTIGLLGPCHSYRRLVASFQPRGRGSSPGQVMWDVLDKMTLGQGFSEYLSFPCQFSFHRLLHIHNLSSGAGKIGQLVADVPSELSLTPP
jgi:hypothetical protein